MVLVLSLITRTLVIYITILLMLRLMGKREIGQLSTFDLVVAIMIAEIAVLTLEDLEMPLYAGLIPIFILVLAEILLSYVCLHSTFLRRLVEGVPSVIIADGKIIEKEMRRQRYNINDLLAQLREKDVFDISDVRYAVLETTGELSVIVKSTKRPLKPEDMNLNPPEEDIPLSLVLDGELLEQNLHYLGLSRGWFEKKLKELGLELEDIMYASMNNQGKLYISEKEKEED